jgi:iron complex outermembrane recepter protein
MTHFYKSNRAPALCLIAQAAIFLIAKTAAAQTAPVAPTSPAAASEVTLKPVTISAPTASAQSDITGFGDVPLQRTPISATIIGAQQINALGAKRLADVIKLDASTSDAYNAIGYWDYATVRGFVLDNKFNYRREGLPISAETYIPLDNKERVEILKGTSGIQAGTSAPGGLVNYAVKRPTAQPLRTIKIEAASGGALGAAADLGGRFGNDEVFGYRFNVAAEKLNTHTPGTKGSRELAALAMDWRIGKDSLLEAEVEYSKRSQPSVPGLSLLGNTVPIANPRININTQPWSLPVELQGTTGSLRFEQALSNDWRWSAQMGTQRLKSQDRVAFPFGADCFGVGVCDRYAANGDYDLYDFRSENERRTTDAAKFELKGQFATGSVRHALNVGALVSRFTERGQLAADDNAPVGTGNINTSTVLPPDLTFGKPYTNRTERSTELFASDAIAWTPALQTWLGLRHTRLHRESVRTNGSRATDYSAGITTPWLAASYQINPALMAYASTGQGIESQVVPNKSQYTNGGVALPVLKSRQTEIGIKGAADELNWSLTGFNIVRPVSNLDACNRLLNGGAISSCLGDYDGSAKHTGLEAAAQMKLGAWTLGGGITALHARREGGLLEPQNNGQPPANVPDMIARLNADYRFASLPGLAASANLSHEGTRSVLPDGSITLPAWTRVDAGLSYGHKMGAAQATWTLGIDNLFNKQFFKESPYQFGHVYLFPQQERTVRVGLNVSL